MKSLKITNLTDEQHDILYGIVNLIKLNPREPVAKTIWEILKMFNVRFFPALSDIDLSNGIFTLFKRKAESSSFRAIDETNKTLSNTKRIVVGDNILYLKEFTGRVIGIDNGNVVGGPSSGIYIYRSGNCSIQLDDGTKFYHVPFDLVDKVVGE